MTSLKPSHIQLEYEQFGDASAPPIILIMGLYGQMIDWPDSFCEILVEAGFQVIRFDNRDIGLSQRLEHLSTPNPYNASFYLTWGLKPPAPYNLDDMASDVIGLMDALKLQQAHIVGSSMGGMIGQILASENLTGFFLFAASVRRPEVHICQLQTGAYGRLF